MSYIFISYSNHDKVYARRLAEKLKHEGFDIWIDDRIDYGDDWELAIFDAIDSCASFVVIMSPESYKSKWVRRECHHTEKRDTPPFPILLDGEEFPRYGLTQYFDARDKKLPGNDFFSRLEQVTPRKESVGVDVTEPSTMTSHDVTFELGAQLFGSPSLNLLREAGMTWIKRQVVYHAGDDPGMVGQTIQTTHDQGFRILLNVVGNPMYIAEDSATYFAEFAAFLSGIAKNNADAIQVWNEPNIDRNWPNGAISGGNYTNMLRTAYLAIKAVNPNVMVVSAAPAPTGYFGGKTANGGCDDNVFIQQMAEAGASNYLDCVGIHYKEGVVSPDEISGDPRDNSEHYTRYLKEMINRYKDTFPAKPLCFDELGFLTSEGYGPLPPGFEWAQNVTIHNQADWLAWAASVLKQDGRVRLMIVWNFDSTVYASDPQAGYAILRRDGSCPACITLGSVMRRNS